MVSIHKGSRGQPEVSRKAILDAAARAFASDGFAGARTEAIAKEAGVNKALLHYYFRDKEGLYGAVLQGVFQELLAELREVLDSDWSAGEKLMTYALTHFNYVAAHPHYRRVVQHEMMRASGGESRHVAKLVEEFFRPLMQRLEACLNEGMKAGEFRQVNPMHFLQSMIAVVVFYFTALPVTRAIASVDPLSAEGIARRREAMLDFISAALFREHARGERVVAKVLRDYKETEPLKAVPKRPKIQDKRGLAK